MTVGIWQRIMALASRLTTVTWRRLSAVLCGAEELEIAERGEESRGNRDRDRGRRLKPNPPPSLIEPA